MKRPILFATMLAAAALLTLSAARAGEAIPVPAAETPGQGVCRLDGPITYTLRAPRGAEGAMSELGAWLETQGWRPAAKGHALFEARLVDDARRFPAEEAYRLTIAPKRITAEARTTAGLFYAVQTFLQLSDDGTAPQIACRTIDVDGGRDQKVKSFSRFRILCQCGVIRSDQCPVVCQFFYMIRQREPEFGNIFLNELVVIADNAVIRRIA